MKYNNFKKYKYNLFFSLIKNEVNVLFNDTLNTF